MKTKILLGNIGAVTILILVSFTNVVNVQSKISGSVNESPLFNIRIQKETNQMSKFILTSDYIGKGIYALPFPLRDNRTALIQKGIDIIEKMDDKEFNRFQSLILSRFYEEKNDINIDATQLVSILRQLKSNPKELKILLNNIGNNKNNDPPTLFTAWDGCCPTFYLDPHCYLTLIIALVLMILLLPFMPLFRLLTLDIACSPEI